MATIRQYHTWLQNLEELQSRVIRAVDGEIERVEADRAVANKKLRNTMGAIVLVDDDARYAALTKAALEVGREEDYTSIVADFRRQDKKNREERTQLQTQWGPRKDVAQKVAVLASELDVVRAALREVSPEIAAFDETTAKIEAHNEKYPKAPINEENHDGYEEFKLGRFLLWLTFINRGPHKAYQVVSAYNKVYGDYYEDARAIAGLRKNEEELKQSEGAKAKEHAQLEAVVKRMDMLDDTYRGPEGIATEVAQRVYKALLTHVEFAGALHRHVPIEAVAQAGAEAAKMRALDKVKEFLKVEAKQVRDVREQIAQPVSVLTSALSRVGSEHIHYDSSAIDDAVQRGINVTNRAVRDAETARAAIDNAGTLGGQFDLARLESKLHSFTTLTAVGNELNLDFTRLTQLVRREVEEYEEEQRRRREAERAAREAQEALARAARQAAARMNQQRSGGGSIGGSFGGAGRSSGGIGGGSSGIGGRSGGGSIGGGSRGIGPR